VGVRPAHTLSFAWPSAASAGTLKLRVNVPAAGWPRSAAKASFQSAAIWPTGVKPEIVNVIGCPGATTVRSTLRLRGVVWAPTGRLVASRALISSSSTAPAQSDAIERRAAFGR
jgi:hypothetical protein